MLRNNCLSRSFQKSKVILKIVLLVLKLDFTDLREDETEDDDINVGGNEPPSAFFGFWFKVLPL